MPHITSRQNPVVARYRAAREGQAEGDTVMLDGVHLVGEALASGAALRDVVVAAGATERPDVSAVLKALARARVAITTASPVVMAALSPVRSSSPIVALATAKLASEERVFAGTPLAVLAVDVQDPGNLGAIVRVAEAAGATGVVVAGSSADPLGWKAVRGSMGSALRLPIARAPDAAAAIATARRRKCRILATTPRDGRPVFAVDWTKPSAILIGSEGGGLPEAIVDGADERVMIPMQSPVESLNAAVAAAVMLYEAYRQRQRAT